MAEPFLSVTGSSVEKLIDDLQASEKALAKEQRKAHRKVAAQVVKRAQAAAGGGTRREAKYARAIKPAATATVARIRIANGKTTAGAGATFWGAKRRSGWYGAQKYNASPAPQHPKWVGNTWLAGRRGEGPHVINDVIASYAPEIDGMYQDAHVEALSQAFGKD